MSGPYRTLQTFQWILHMMPTTSVLPRILNNFAFLTYSKALQLVHQNSKRGVFVKIILVTL